MYVYINVAVIREFFALRLELSFLWNFVRAYREEKICQDRR